MIRSIIVMRELIRKDMFFSDYWQEHYGDGLAGWTPVTLNVLGINDDRRMELLEEWLREQCDGGWSWRGLIADSEHINITFFFSDRTLAILFKLTFG